ncbi:glycosyltransferase family 2 protein [Vibrio sp. 10N.222.55.F12]|uniref:glycosyltransferase family 2 protein n=1 Tax=Vibrio sp. 10N.222.55.F12 TaxID=3229653 RepID=UPI00354E4CF8
MSVTVAIPIFNAEEYLEDAIQSVLNQTYTDFELILLDDGSTDTSLDIAKSFDDPRIRVISDSENLGLPARLNQVTKLARYDLIARMDADDIIPNNRLSVQVTYLEDNPTKDLVSMGMVYFDSDTYHGHFIPEERGDPLNLVLMEKGASRICHATLLVRKAWYQRNQYDATAERIEDFELWLRAFKREDLSVGYIPKIGYFYRSDNTLTYNKYYKVYKSFFKLFLGLYGTHKLRFKPLINICIKFLLISMIFLIKKQDKFLSMKRRSLHSKSIELEFDTQMANLSKVRKK